MLRGFAVFGILLANIEAFADPGYLHRVAPLTGADAVAADLVAFVVESKFYVLFGFLFGYGLAVQLGRSLSGARMARRLALLFVIGAVHAVLLFAGDILMIYAIAGVLLFLLRGISAKRAAVLGISILALFASLLMVAILSGSAPVGEPAPGKAEAVLANYRGDSAGVVAQRIEDLQEIMLTWWSLVPIILAYFLLGLAAGKTGLLHGRTIPRTRLWKALVVGLAVGLPPAALFAFTTDGSGSWGIAMQGVGYFTAPALTMAYAAAMLLFGDTAVGSRVHAMLAPVGRLALTNYLAQSAICALLFTGYGLALAGETGLAGALAIAMMVYAVQVVFSGWWSRRHAFGPAEWVLRSVTYWRRQPWRSAVSASR